MGKEEESLPLSLSLCSAEEQPRRHREPAPFHSFLLRARGTAAQHGDALLRAAASCACCFFLSLAQLSEVRRCAAQGHGVREIGAAAARIAARISVFGRDIIIGEDSGETLCRGWNSSEEFFF